MLFNEKRLSFETLDYLWTIAPFSLRFCESKPQNNFLAIHKDIEFHYVFDGKETYTLGEREYLLDQGSLICVNSYVPHNYYTLNTSKSVSIIVSTNFLIRNGLDVGKSHFDEFIIDPDSYRLFSEIVDEMEENDTAHNITMCALILKFVAYVVRMHSRIRSECDSSNVREILGATYDCVWCAIDYISENFTNNISIDELSSLCNVSKYHFIRIFKQVTGYTPNSYINRVRTNYAKQLLLNGAGVTAAATASGFSDVHYFSNCFKKYNGCRPSVINHYLNKEDTLP